MSFYICRWPCPKEQGRRGAVEQRIRSIPGVLLPPAHHDWYCKPAKTTLSMVISVKPPSWIIEVAKCVFVPSIAWFISPVVIRSAASLHIRGRVPVRLSQNAPIRDSYVRPDGQPCVLVDQNQTRNRETSYRWGWESNEESVAWRCKQPGCRVSRAVISMIWRHCLICNANLNSRV